MWGSLVALALLSALNPVRLGLTLLVISRSRPVQNLLAYWIGCLIGCIPAVVAPLALMHFIPGVKSLAAYLAMSPTVGHIRVGIGVVVLSIAALLIVRSLNHRRRPAQVLTSTGPTSNMLLESNNPLSRLLGGRVQDTAREDKTAPRRLTLRIRSAWESGSLWVAAIVGMAFGGVDPETGAFFIAIIVGSGAAIGTQVVTAVVFVILVLAVVEITLISYLFTPSRTQAVLQRLHDWAWAHRRKILIVMLLVGGFALLARGIIGPELGG